jgi:hypothetical protein
VAPVAEQTVAPTGDGFGDCAEAGPIADSAAPAATVAAKAMVFSLLMSRSCRWKEWRARIVPPCGGRHNPEPTLSSASV